MEQQTALQEWRKSRAELLREEKAITRQLEKVAQKRREMPMVEIVKPTCYIFLTSEGHPVTLPDMFEGRQQLIVYHQMPFGANDEGCGGCAFFSDHIPREDVLQHLQSRNTTFAATAPEDPDILKRFSDRMGWQFPFYSSKNTWKDEFWKPNDGSYRLNCFSRSGDRVFLTWDTEGRGVEPVLTTYALLDMTKLGRQDQEGHFLFHDQYEAKREH